MKSIVVHLIKLDVRVTFSKYISMTDLNLATAPLAFCLRIGLLTLIKDHHVEIKVVNFLKISDSGKTTRSFTDLWHINTWTSITETSNLHILDYRRLKALQWVPCLQHQIQNPILLHIMAKVWFDFIAAVCTTHRASR